MEIILIVTLPFLMLAGILTFSTKQTLLRLRDIDKNIDGVIGGGRHE